MDDVSMINTGKSDLGSSISENDLYSAVYRYSAPGNTAMSRYYYSTEAPTFSGWTRDGVEPVFYVYKESGYGTIAVYQYSNSSKSYFMLSTSDSIPNWDNLGVAFHACPNNAGQTVQIVSYLNDKYGQDSYSYIVDPLSLCPAGYIYSLAQVDAGFAVPFNPNSTTVPGAVPIYRYSRPLDNSGHETYYYSTGKDGLPEWDYKGMAFYAYGTQVSGTIPVYGSRKTLSDGTSIYQLSRVESNQNGWIVEGVAFYAFSDGDRIAGSTLVSPAYLSIAGESGTYSTYYFANGSPIDFALVGNAFSAFIRPASI